MPIVELFHLDWNSTLCVCVFCSEGVLHTEELLEVCVCVCVCGAEDVAGSLSQCYQDQSSGLNAPRGTC